MSRRCSMTWTVRLRHANRYGMDSMPDLLAYRNRTVASSDPDIISGWSGGNARNTGFDNHLTTSAYTRLPLVVPYFRKIIPQSIAIKVRHVRSVVIVRTFHILCMMLRREIRNRWTQILRLHRIMKRNGHRRIPWMNLTHSTWCKCPLSSILHFHPFCQIQATSNLSVKHITETGKVGAPNDTTRIYSASQWLYW